MTESKQMGMGNVEQLKAFGPGASYYPDLDEPKFESDCVEGRPKRSKKSIYDPDDCDWFGHFSED